MLKHQPLTGGEVPKPDSVYFKFHYVTGSANLHLTRADMNCNYAFSCIFSTERKFKNIFLIQGM